MNTSLISAEDEGVLYTQMNGLNYIKAHGTSNDFILINDPQAAIDLDPVLIRDLCQRKSGLGADGLIRISQARNLVARGILADYPAGVTPDMWFMDYYNHDGTTAEICGNGTRVFAHIVYILGYQTELNFSIGTRAGAREISFLSPPSMTVAEVEVAMGPVQVLGTAECVLPAAGQEYSLRGDKLSVGNPHLACVISDEIMVDLAEWELPKAQISVQDFPSGTNLEIIYPLRSASAFSAKMRVLERGVGETAACGSGAVAAAYSLLTQHARVTVPGKLVRILLPGGELRIRFDEQQAYLAGASHIVSEGKFFH